jgi:trafficking protein particle complex subunit 9
MHGLPGMGWSVIKFNIVFGYSTTLLQNSSFSGQRGPWVDVADKLIQASALYQKGPLAADGGEQYSLIAFLYTSVVLRNASLLFATWSAKGWGPLAFTTMLQPGPSPVLPPTLSNPDGISVVGLERLSSLSGITRSQIAEVIADAHGPWLLHLGQSERIMTLETMAGLYSSLGYKRKESYILREILGCIMDLIVVGRDDPVVQSPMPIASPGVGLGIQGVITNGIGTVGIRVNERTEGNESIIRLVRYICRVHGINMDAVPLGDPETVRAADKESDEVSSLPPQQFGWPELQIGIVREALAVAEALPGTVLLYFLQQQES